MKKILCAALASAVFAAAICGCSGQKSPSSGSSSDQPSGKTATYDEAPTENSVSTTGNKVHIKDSTLGDIWITELEGVAKNTLKAENFTSDATFKYYSEDGKAASEEGIDISSYTGEIDWKKVKAAGVDFAMVRLGGRGYGEDSSLYSDDKALEYIKGAQAENIKVGGYFFSQATTSDEAAEEAEYVKDLLDGTKLEYPIAFDWEIIKDENARTDSVSSTQATECAKVFCESIKNYGYKPMIYSPARELYFKYDLTQLKDFDIWFVDYTNVPEFYYQFTMWQYSETGSVDGIEGTVDLNICFTNIANY